MTIQPAALILVAVLPKERGLESARLLGQYRIISPTATRVAAVDRLAFCQPGSFGEQGGGQYTADVRGHELITRAERLHEEAGRSRAGEECHKRQIGPLEALPVPLLAESWRRITFLSRESAG